MISWAHRAGCSGVVCSAQEVSDLRAENPPPFLLVTPGIRMGDGETQEGQVWEGAMSAHKYKLDNLTVILDYNKAQIDGYTKDVMDLEPLADKLRAFNWHVISIDGHDYGQIMDALDEAETVKGRPTYIICHTVKGKGVSFAENNLAWHHKSRISDESIQEIFECLRV